MWYTPIMNITNARFAYDTASGQPMPLPRRKFLQQLYLITSGIILTPTLVDIIEFNNSRCFWSLDKTMIRSSVFDQVSRAYPGILAAFPRQPGPLEWYGLLPPRAPSLDDRYIEFPHNNN